MKLEELEQFANQPGDIGHIVIQRIFDLPLDDCTDEEMTRIANKLNKICSIEDNGSIIIALAQSATLNSLSRIRRFRPEMIIQVLLMYGFTLGYMQRGKEKYQDIPFLTK